MGMFDYIRCDYPLPAPGANGMEYQTKDTPSQYLYRYVITEDGRLKHQETDYEEPPLQSLPWIWDGDFTGEIRFYDHGDGKWIEFSAYFARGMLKELHLIKDERSPAPTASGNDSERADK